MNLEGRTTRLRALEPGDIELMYAWENDTEIWGVSGTLAPFSRHTLERFIEGQQFDHFPNPPAAAYHRNPGRPPRRGARPVRPGSGKSPCGRRHPDPRYGTTGQRLCRRCGGDRMQLCPRHAAPASVMVQRRSRKCGQASHFSATPDSPKRGSGKSGCGLPTDSTTRFSCKKYYDLRRLAQRHKTNPPPISPNSSGRKGPPGESFERGLRDGASKPFPGSRYAQCALF